MPFQHMYFESVKHFMIARSKLGITSLKCKDDLKMQRSGNTFCYLNSDRVMQIKFNVFGFGVTKLSSKLF